MNIDIVSLRVLIVTNSALLRALLRQGAAQASLPAEVLEADSAAAAEAFIREGTDVLLLDGGMPPAERARICKSARSAKDRPFLVMVGKSASDAEIDGRVERPVSEGEAQEIVDSCIRARMPRRALIVDDSSTMRGIVRKILSASRFPLELAETEDGTSALRQLREGGFDLVFLDYNMPGLDGFEILNGLGGPESPVAVVMMTSTDNPEVAERARRAGAAAFLKKPFFPADVDAVLYRMHKIEAPARP
jgi:CheY-like chemotaxis protein